MEKFGVEIEEPDKTASEKKPAPETCPRCGATLRAKEEVNVLLCPNCGSLPFEAR